VWFAGGSAVPAEELCNAEGGGKARRRETERGTGRKGNRGSDEGDPKPPSVSEKKTGQRRAGLEKRVDVDGDEQKELLSVA
jgi:hypothetical protein